MAIERTKSARTTFFRDFIHRRFNGWALLITLGCGFGVLFYFETLRPVSVFPSANHFNFCFFTDTANEGNSVITSHSLSDSAIEMNFELRKGFVDPYVSISISPKKDSLLNLSYYNRLIIDLQGLNTENIGFDLITPCTIPSNPPKDTIVDSYYNLINLSHERKQYTIDLNELKVPDYWYVNNNLAPVVKIRPNFKQVLSFNIGTAYATQFDVPRSLRIYAIRFDRDNRQLAVVILFCELFAIAILLAAHYFRTLGDNRNRQVTISYQPVDIPFDKKNQQNGFLDYINHHFHDPELSLGKVSIQTGINQRTIANTIHELFGINFKSYLNQLRIHESKRLLKTTTLTMGEIAVAAGFNTQSHFNRVFKSAVGISPTEYKNAEN